MHSSPSRSAAICAWLVTFSSLSFGCDGAGPADETTESLHAFSPPVTLVDQDPDEDIVELDLKAELADVAVVPGVTRTHRTFEGTIPAPVMRGKLGDRLVVHFSNLLPEPTTIHWHGMRVPNGMDGVPGLTQEVVEPGGEFHYEFELKDAGIFFYHPHFETLLQVGDGMYGAVVVDDPNDSPDLGVERILIFSDMSLYPDGGVQTHPENNTTILNGREGNLVLINGVHRPEFTVRAGQRERWRILNAARSRYIKLTLPGHRFTHIGSDGGRLEYPQEVEAPLITPAERYELLVEFDGEPGSTMELLAAPWMRTPDGAPPDAEVLATIRFED